MALEATHMRFALDLKNKYQVRNIKKYIVGTIYPDSRYLSGIDRTLTHSEKFLDENFAKNDFHKGWQVHQLVDIIQTEIIKELFPNFVPIFAKENKFIQNEWHTFSAIKIIQAMDDMQKFDLQKCLTYLNSYAFNPNGENLEDIKKYNQIMIDLYQGKKITTIDDNYKMWVALGVNKKDGLEIKKQTQKLLKDKNIISEILGIYDKMLERVEDGKIFKILNAKI